MEQTGAQIIVRSLIAQGVDTVFGYPGGQVLDIFDEFHRHASKIRLVLTAHEQGAAHAADGYARATGRVGVCLATSGPGATNLVTGIATAYLDSVPVVAITGNVACPMLGKDSFQEVDIVGITIPVTKHSYALRQIGHLPSVINEAFAIASTARPGPVLIDIPRDLQTAATDAPVLQPMKPGTGFRPRQESIDAAVEMIKAASRPYIYCGGGVINANAQDELVALAEKIDACIGTSMMGVAAVPASNARRLGMSGMHGREASIRAMDKADLVIAAGVRFSDRATGNKQLYTSNKRFMHIDVDPAEIGKNIPVDLEIAGDVLAVLSSLNASVDEMRHPLWREQVEAMRDEEARHRAACAQTGGQVSPQALIAAVADRAPDEACIVTDVGQHQMWVAQEYPFKAPRSFLTSGGLGAMGFGMGAAIGACMSLGGHGRRTVLFTGDGSFGMNLNELATAVSQRLPLVVVILNNGVLGMVRQWQTLFYGRRYSATTLDRKTDFVALAKAFGATGERVCSPDELDGALDAAFSSPGPFVLDCLIDPDSMVLPMIPPGKAVSDMMVSMPERRLP
jgi:acetolactate synthase-1/2/3 large subunit